MERNCITRSNKSDKDDSVLNTPNDTMDEESFSNITVDAYIDELWMSARDSQVQKLENMLSKGKLLLKFLLLGE